MVRRGGEIRAAKGREPIPATGDLERDLYRAAEQARAVLSSKEFQKKSAAQAGRLAAPAARRASVDYL